MLHYLQPYLLTGHLNWGWADQDQTHFIFFSHQFLNISTPQPPFGLLSSRKNFVSAAQVHSHVREPADGQKCCVTQTKIMVNVSVNFCTFYCHETLNIFLFTILINYWAFISMCIFKEELLSYFALCIHQCAVSVKVIKPLRCSWRASGQCMQCLSYMYISNIMSVIPTSC